MEKAPRTRLITALLLAVVFGSGLVVGLAVDSNLVAGPVEEPATEEEASTERRRAPMYEQVGPNEAQKTSIDSIVRERPCESLPTASSQGEAASKWFPGARATSISVSWRWEPARSRSS